MGTKTDGRTACSVIPVKVKWATCPGYEATLLWDNSENWKGPTPIQMLKEPRSHVKFLGTFSAGRAGNIVNRQTSTRTPEQLLYSIWSQRQQSFQNIQFIEETLPDLSALRAAAIAAGNETPSRKTKQAFTTYIDRCIAIRDYALARSSGVCECCAQNAPFITLSGVPFLEVHHIRRLSDGGPDKHDAVAAICPNCHREAHHGKEAKVLNEELSAKILAIEASAK